MKKKVDNSSIIDANNVEVPKQKERHIVSWSQEEDDILREQIRVHGTGNWTIIASKFKDKTTRQCRRRWFTYLNADFKKGGWSPEEDMLLCEAQKLFGNRWTEIAKVVSGRTDNAVKNRFTTLCKKRAKHEALAKENSATSYVNLNNKRVMFPNGLNANGGSDCFPPLKKRRPCISNTTENCIQQEKFPAGFGPPDHLDRHPFAMLPENAHSCEVNVSTQLPFSHVKATSFDGSVNNSTRGNFLKKDDPKVLALMQQAELLSSLATKVNSERTDQSLDSAWMVFQDFLKQNIESDMTASRISETDFQLEKNKKTVKDFRSSNEGSRSSWREPDTHESSPASSEYSTGSTLPSNLACDKTEEMQLEDQRFLAEESTDLEKVMLTCDDIIDNTRMVCGYFDSEFSSPLHVTPLFGSLTTAIPSPQFSESEKHFLLKTLGMESTPSSITTNPSQPPPCKRSLLHCL